MSLYLRDGLVMVERVPGPGEGLVMDEHAPGSEGGSSHG